MNKILFVLLSLLTSLQSYSQEQNEKEVSFLLLGDIHYDLLEDHDMEWLSTKNIQYSRKIHGRNSPG